MNHHNQSSSPTSYTERVDPSAFQKRVKPELSFLTFELTYRCINNCIHCNKVEPSHNESEKAKELTTAQLTDLFHQAAELGVLLVKFTGGEPLLRDDFTELYLTARQLGMSVKLNTTASLITPQLAKLFARIPPKAPISITVYGMTDETYTAVTRNPGSFESAFNGIRLLEQNRVPFHTVFMSLKPNVHEEQAYLNWSAPYRDGTEGIKRKLLLRSRRDSELRNKKIIALRPNSAEIAQKTVNLPKELNYSDLLLRDKLHTTEPIVFRCGFGRNSCAVDPYGNLLGCLDLPNPELMYDLRTGSLREGIFGFFEEIRHRQSSSPQFKNECSVCFLRGWCDNCAAKSWSENGTLDTPVSYYCDEAHNRARLLGLLSNEEKGWEVENWQERVSAFLKTSEQTT